MRAAGGAAAADAEVDLEGRFLLPALVNAHDVLDLSTLPPLGRPPYASLYEWTRAAEEDLSASRRPSRCRSSDRLFLGGLRNLLAGVAAVLHHHPDHRSLGAGELPGAGAAAVRLRALARAHRGPAQDVSHQRPPHPVAGAGGRGRAIRACGPSSTCWPRRTCSGRTP